MEPVRRVNPVVFADDNDNALPDRDEFRVTNRESAPVAVKMANGLNPLMSLSFIR
jgi:hypothetical protein